MKNNERLVYFFDLHIGVNKQNASPPTAREVFDCMQRSVESSAASLKINKDTATVQILDMRFVEEFDLVTVYIRFSDKNGPDVYFSDTDANTSRVVRKQGDEGRGFGAHFSVSLIEQNGVPNVYLAVLEKVSGVNSSIVVRLFQSIFHVMYKVDGNLFTCDDISGARDRNGQPKRIGFRPMLKLQGLPSDQFISDLENGTLQEIHLIEDKAGGQFAARPWLIEKQNVVRLGLTGGRVQNLWNNLTGFFSEQSEQGFKKARIKFRRVDGEADAVDVDAETGELLDHKYVKAKRICDIDPPLDECADNIVAHFALMVEQEVVANRT